MELGDSILYNREEKLSYIIKVLNLKTNDIAEKLEISAGLVSQIQNHYNNKLRKIHLYALSNAYHIPMEIFENDKINTEEMIQGLLKKSSLKSIFTDDHNILKKLLGTWYLYSYPSNQSLSEVWSTETHIYDDFRVEDVHKNRGLLHIGTNQSLIIKESHNSKNITTTIFDNARITYGNFPFSRIAKSNSFNREILSFGFFSKRKIEKQEAQKILGQIKNVQLQMDYNFIERISSSIKMEG